MSEEPERKDVKVMASAGDLQMMFLLATLLANKNVYDISDADIVRAHEVAARITKMTLFGRPDAVI